MGRLCRSFYSSWLNDSITDSIGHGVVWNTSRTLHRKCLCRIIVSLLVSSVASISTTTILPHFLLLFFFTPSSNLWQSFFFSSSNRRWEKKNCHTFGDTATVNTHVKELSILSWLPFSLLLSKDYYFYVKLIFLFLIDIMYLLEKWCLKVRHI